MFAPLFIYQYNQSKNGREKNGKFDSGRTRPSAGLFTICQRQIRTWTPQRVSAHLRPVLPPVCWQRAPLSVPKVTSRREREREKPGRKEGGGGAGGTRSKAQEVGKDEEPRDNVMHRGDEPEERRRRRPKRNVGRGGGESRRRRAQGVCIWHWEAGRDSVGQAGRTCVFVFD